MLHAKNLDGTISLIMRIKFFDIEELSLIPIRSAHTNEK